MKLLIIYGTTEGQTRKIAEFLKAEAENAGAEVSVCDATMQPSEPDGFDRVLIAASLHNHRYQSSVAHYVRANHEKLNNIPSAFVSVSLSALRHDEAAYQATEQIAAGFLTDTGWKPGAVEHVAGALRYSEYDFFKKWVMRMIAKAGGKDTDTSHDYEYTDWEQLKTFLHGFMKTN